MKSCKIIKPEKLVEKLVIAECRNLGFDVDVIDSKATYSKNTESYMRSQSAPEGAPDLWGNTSDGIAVYIELKAQGKTSNLSEQQRAFLYRKIVSGCFAICVDRPALVFQHYYGWKKEGQSYLLSVLDAI